MLMTDKNFYELLVLVAGAVQYEYSYMVLLFFRIFRNRNSLVHFISSAIDFIISFIMKFHMVVVVCTGNARRVGVRVSGTMNFYLITCQRFIIRQQCLNVDVISRLIFLMVGRCNDFYGRFFLVQRTVVIIITSNER